MQLGLVGLGKMGFNMRDRVRDAGHEVIGYDRNPTSPTPSHSRIWLAGCDAPRTVWVMVPAGEPTSRLSVSSPIC